MANINIDDLLRHQITLSRLETSAYRAHIAPSLAEYHHDDEAVDKFAYQMKVKLASARKKGRSGWDNPDLCTIKSLVEMLVDHLQKPNDGNWIDIANFCMMLHLRGANSGLLVTALAEHDAEVARKAFIAGCNCGDKYGIFEWDRQADEYAQRIKDGEI